MFAESVTAFKLHSTCIIVGERLASLYYRVSVTDRTQVILLFFFLVFRRSCLLLLCLDLLLNLLPHFSHLSL